jgi:hypothetical protein
MGEQKLKSGVEEEKLEEVESDQDERGRLRRVIEETSICGQPDVIMEI